MLKDKITDLGQGPENIELFFFLQSGGGCNIQYCTCYLYISGLENIV